MNTEAYKHNMERPQAPVQPRRPRRLRCPSSVAECESLASELRDYESAMAEYNTKWQEYKDKLLPIQQEESRLLMLFKSVALKELGLTGHPKADALWQLAWDRGHGGGLSDVWNEMQELAPLVTP